MFEQLGQQSRSFGCVYTLAAVVVGYVGLGYIACNGPVVWEPEPNFPLLVFTERSDDGQWVHLVFAGELRTFQKGHPDHSFLPSVGTSLAAIDGQLDSLDRDDPVGFHMESVGPDRAKFVVSAPRKLGDHINRSVYTATQTTFNPDWHQSGPISFIVLRTAIAPTVWMSFLGLSWFVARLLYRRHARRLVPNGRKT